MTARLPNCFSASLRYYSVCAAIGCQAEFFYGEGDFINIIMTLILGIAGGALGYMIPYIANSIALYKCRKKKAELVPDERYSAIYLKLGFCALNGSVWGISGYIADYMPAAVLMAFLFTTALLVAIIDLRIRIVPNELLLVMIVTGIAFQAMKFGYTAILVSCVCMAVMVVFFTLVAGMVGFDKVGAGDVKLAGAMGLALGYPNILTALVIMSAVFVVFSLVGLILRKLTLKTMLPFAPFMMIGMIFTLAYLVL